jgi:amino acid transporter
MNKSRDPSDILAGIIIVVGGICGLLYSLFWLVFVAGFGGEPTDGAEWKALFSLFFIVFGMRVAIKKPNWGIKTRELG